MLCPSRQEPGTFGRSATINTRATEKRSRRVPFVLDAETLKSGLNFTFTTDIGDLDLLEEVRGIGQYEDVIVGAVMVDLFGHRFAVIDIGKLIVAKRAAGRPKDLIAIPELEAIQEAQALENQKEP